MFSIPIAYANRGASFNLENEFSFPSLPYDNHSPFIHVMNEFETTTYFISSVQNNEWDNVKSMLSMALQLDSSIDVTDLKKFFDGQRVYKTYTPRRDMPGNIRTHSLYLRDEKEKESGIVHVHLQREKGSWKVMGVERE